MGFFDKYDISLDDKHRHWMFDVINGIVLQGMALFDEFGEIFNRTNPIPVEQLAKAQFFGGVFVDQNGSAQGAIDARFTGATTEVHDGEDTPLWTGANLVGGSVTFDSVTRGFGGSAQSIFMNAMSDGDIFELDSGPTVDLSNRTSLSIRVWVVGGYAGDLIEFYAVDSLGAQIGNRINLADLIEESTVGAWQAAVILTADMGLATATIAGLRFEQVAKVAAAPILNLDLIQFHESGGPVVLVAAAPPGFRVRVSCIITTMSGPYVTAITNNGSTGLSPIGFLAVPTLDQGILIAQAVNGVFGVQAIWRNLRDTGSFGYFVAPPLTDGTDTTIYIVREFDTPIVIEGPVPANNLQIHLNDDFTALDDSFTVFTGTIEPI